MFVTISFCLFAWDRQINERAVAVNIEIHNRAILVQIALLWITGWRRPIGCFKLQVIFRRRGINYRALLRKMAYKDKASYESLPPCTVTIASNLWIPMQAFFLVTIQKTQVRNWRIVVEGNDSSTSILGRARRPVQSRWRDCVCLCFFVHYERDFLEPF